MKLCPGGGLMPGGPGGIFFGRPGGGGGGILKLAWGRGAVMDHQKIIAHSGISKLYLITSSSMKEMVDFLGITEFATP
jgi:hypothetical protein